MPPEVSLLSRLIASEKVLARLFLHRVVHVVLTCIVLWLAYVFLDDTPTFSTSSSFRLMAGWGQEREWGGVLFSIGLVGIVTSYFNGWVVRTVAACLLSATHLCLALLFVLGNPHAPGVGFLFGYAILGAALAYSTAHVGKRLSKHVADAYFP